MKIGVATDKGRARKVNEDAFWYSDHIFLVCDGMGGHLAGEVASSMAVEAIKEYSFGAGDLRDEVRRAIQRAHQRIIAAAESKGLMGMGTTLTMAAVERDNETNQIVIGHVGDSRAYLLRGFSLCQLTNDHSVVGELVRNGTLTECEAESHPHRHVLTQALGAGLMEIEVEVVAIEPGDRLILCTDGLFGVVSAEEISHVVASMSVQEAAERLVDLANEGGGPDNITVLIAEFDEERPKKGFRA